jgi:iron complex outermembrane receptor protein
LSGDTDRMHWVGGVYYMDLEIKDSNGAITDPFIDPDGLTPLPSGLDNPYETNTESWSVFGQVELDLTDTLTGIFGLRWIRDEKDHFLQVNAVDFPGGTQTDNRNPILLENLATYRGDREDDEIAGRLGLNWQVSDEVMLYASYNRGVKGGGYNAPVFPLTPPLDYVDDVISFDPEILDAYEIGFKSTWNDGLMIINGAAYVYDYSDYQAFQIVGIDTITTNADADSYGAELEVQVAPIEGLDIIFGAAYNDIEVDLGGGAPKTSSVQSPEWNLNALVRYEFPLMNGTFALQWDAQYRSEHYFSLTGAETVTENGYTLHNAAASWTSGDSAWTVTAFVQNLSDEEYLVQTFDLSGPNVFGMVEQYYGRPRWSGVSLQYSF